LQVVEVLSSKCYDEELELFVVISRRTWFHWNTIVHGEEFLDPNIVARGAMESFYEYKKVMALEGDQRRRESGVDHLRWKAHLVDIHKANWYVAIDKTNGRMGLGDIVRDYKGDVIAAKSLTKLGKLEPVSAEPLEALHAREFCRDLGLMKIVMECDGLQIYSQYCHANQTKLEEIWMNCGGYLRSD
jgi:hypothetical protein